MKVEANWNRVMAGERAARPQMRIWTGMLQFTQPQCKTVAGAGGGHQEVTKQIHCRIFSDVVGGQPEVKGTGWRAGTLLVEFPPSYFNFATRITTLLHETTQVKTLNMELTAGSGLLEALRSVQAGLIYTSGTALGEAVIFLLYLRESNEIKAFTHANSMEAVRRLLRRAQRDRGTIHVRDPVNLLEALRQDQARQVEVAIPRQDGEGANGNAAPQAGPSPPPHPPAAVVDVVVVPPPNLNLGAQPQPLVEQQRNEQAPPAPAPPAPAPAQGIIIRREPPRPFLGYEQGDIVAIRRHFRDAVVRNLPPDDRNNPQEVAEQRARRRMAILVERRLVARQLAQGGDQRHAERRRPLPLPARVNNEPPAELVVEDNFLVKYRPDQRGNPDFCALDILEMIES